MQYSGADTARLALQIAKHFGAHVTAVCGTVNLQLVKSLGADRALDYTADNDNVDAGPYDVFFDAAGAAKGSSLKRPATNKEA